MSKEEFLRTFPGLVKNYQPTPAALERIKNVALLIIIGPSGVGKSSVIDRLGLQFVPSDTTRVARPEEENDVDFYFLTGYAQIIADIKAGNFVQVAVGPGGDFYATRASSYPSEGTAVMPVIADVVPIFRKLGFKQTISAFITPPSYNEWMRRMGSHRLEGEQLKKRLAEAKCSFSFALNDDLTHFILNDELLKATAQVKQLLKGSIDTTRENLARAAAQEMLDSIN